MEMFRAQAPGQLPFGKAADRRDVFKSFRPTVVQLAHLMTPFLDKVDTAADVLPLPKGISLSLCGENDQLRISLSEVYAKRFRRAYGYIGEIKLELLYLGRFYFLPDAFWVGPDVHLTDGEGTSTPAQLQLVVQIPWRFGNSPAETTASHIFVRVQAFVSRAAFTSPVQRLAVGDPVVGYLEPTNGPSKSAQLVSWSPTVVLPPTLLFFLYSRWYPQ